MITKIKKGKQIKRIVIISLGILVAAFFGSAIFAHHAMEYIEIESYSTAKRGEFVFHVHYDYMVDDVDNPKADHWEFTPGLSYGILDRLMFDIHTHFAQFGEDHVVEEDRANYLWTGTSPFMEAAAACLQYRLTDGWPVDIAVIAGFEMPFSRAKDLLGSEHNVYGGALVLSRDFGEHGNVCANVDYENEGSNNNVSWALGMKHPISNDPHGIAAGIEVMGDFEGDKWSILPGVYAPLGNERIIFKTGLEFGQERGEDDHMADTLRANASLMYRF